MDAILALFPDASGIKGDTLIEGKANWVELLSFDHGLAMQITKDISNTKRTSGKPNVKDITFTKYIDKTTPIINQRCCEGTPIGEVTIHFAQVEKGAYTEYMIYTLSDVIISSATLRSMPEDKPIETITLNFNKIKWEWKVQDNTGISKGATSGVWDMATNQAK